MNWDDIFYYIDGKLRFKDGTLAETQHSMGYMQVTVNGNLYLSHRVIWEMMNGPIPKGYIIDHKDRVRNNNLIDNLRLVTYSLNQRNRSNNSNNTSGHRGVTKRPNGKWRAQIQVSGVNITLGTFTDIEHAIDARKIAEKQYGFE